MKSKTHCIGILTSGGDCPGLNAAIRGIVKTATSQYDMQVIGILDGFRGLVENRTRPLLYAEVSGILTEGGTILGTSRDKPRKMVMGGEEMDMTAAAVRNAHRLGIDCLVCLGGGGTQKNALHMHEAGGLNVLTLPKTIDNDVPETDTSFGFDTAMNIATEAIDRLHTTASSHQRLMVCEIMGHNAGWLALGSGVAGGADVILIPEIPYDLNLVSEFIRARRRSGRRFSILAVAEGAISKDEARSAKGKKEKEKEKEREKEREKEKEKEGERVKKSDTTRIVLPEFEEPMASRLARELQHCTGIEARMTSLGHVQRGGAPSPADRLLCTRLGAKAAELLAEGVYNVMVAVKSGKCEPVDLKKVVAAKKKTVPTDHPWIQAARLVGTSFGDV
ncbi:MAG TPA: ATP-dependent 6-phosphofructokinase [Planctomycetota bacterium]|nr:ATP-dependent 6-phosphofructokinase [Planctomycetota bacterium]